METYLIYYDESQTSKKYVYYIARSGINTTSDMGDAIEFKDKETALKLKDYLNDREAVTKYKVICVTTTLEEDVK